jgi:hypothetical protein
MGTLLAQSWPFIRPWKKEKIGHISMAFANDIYIVLICSILNLVLNSIFRAAC